MASLQENIINLQLQLDDEQFQLEISRASASLLQLGKSADNAWTAFNNASSAGEGTKILNSAVNDLNKVIDSGYKQLINYQKQLDQLNDSFKAGEIDEDTYAKKSQQIQSAMEQVKSVMSSARTEVSNFNSALGGEGSTSISKWSEMWTSTKTKVSDSISAISTGFKDFVSGIPVVGQVVETTSSVVSTLGTTFDKVGSTVSSVSSVVSTGLDKLGSGFNTLKEKLAPIGNAISTVTSVLGKIGSVAISAGSALTSGLITAVTKVGSVLGSVASTGFKLFQTGMSEVMNTAKDVGSRFLDLDQLIGSTQTSLGHTLSGGADEAQKYIDKIKEFPQSMQAMAEGGKLLAGVMVDANGKAFNADQLYNYTKALEDASIGLGGTSSDVESLGRALGETSAKGTLQAQQFNMLTNNNAAFAKQLKETIIQQSDGAITMSNWADAMKGGQISADAVNQAVTTLGKTYEGQSTKVTNWSQLMTNIDKSLSVGSYELVTEVLGRMGINMDDVSKFAEEFIQGGIKEIPKVLDFISTSIQNVVKYFDGLSPQLSKVAGDVSKSLSKMTPDGLLETFNKIASVVGKLLAPAFKILGDVISSIAMSDTVKQFDDLGTSVDGVGKYFDQFKPQVDEVANAFDDFGKKLDFGGKFDTIVKAGEQLGSVLIPVLADLTAGALEVYGVVAKFVDDIAPTLSDIIGKVVGYIQQLIDGLKPLKGDFEEMGTTSSKAFNDIWKAVSPVIDSLMKFLIPVVSDVVKIFMELYNKILPYVVTWFNNLMPPVKTVIDALTNLWKQVIEPLIPVIMKLVDTALKILNGIMKDLTSVIKDVADAFSNILKGAIDIVKGAIDVVIGVIKAIIDLMTGNWKGAIKDLGNTWDGLGKIIGGFKPIIDGVVKLFEGLWDSVKTIFGNIGSAIGNVIDGIGQILGLSGKAQKSASNIGSSAGKSYTAVSHGVQRAISGASGVSNTVVSAGDSNSSQDGGTTTTNIFNITGSASDAKAIADQIKRRGLL